MEALVLTLIGVAIGLQVLSLWLALATLVEEEGQSSSPTTEENAYRLNGRLLAFLLLPGGRRPRLL